MLPFCCFLKTSGPKCLQYPAQQKVIPGMVLYKVCGVQLWYIRQSRSGLHNNIGRLFGETLLWRHMIGATRCCKRAYFWVIAFSSWETFSLSLDMLQVRKILCPDHARIHGEEMVPWLIHHLLALRSEKKSLQLFPLELFKCWLTFLVQQQWQVVRVRQVCQIMTCAGNPPLPMHPSGANACILV